MRMRVDSCGRRRAHLRTGLLSYLNVGSLEVRNSLSNSFIRPVKQGPEVVVSWRKRSPGCHGVDCDGRVHAVVVEGHDDVGCVVGKEVLRNVHVVGVVRR